MCYYPVNLLLFTNNIFLSFSNTSFGFCSCLSFPYSHSIFLFRNLLLFPAFFLYSDHTVYSEIWIFLFVASPVSVSISLPSGSFCCSFCSFYPSQFLCRCLQDLCICPCACCYLLSGLPCLGLCSHFCFVSVFPLLQEIAASRCP